MAYMKKVSSATADPGYGSGWFKISEAGLNVGSKYLSFNFSSQSSKKTETFCSWKVGHRRPGKLFE